MRFKDITGQVFGRLTILGFSHQDERYKSFWLCQCACGNTHVGQGYKLTSGELVSCGCFQKERQRESGKRHRTHGHGYGTQVYKAWQSLKDRCLNPKHRQYSEYGGRGITVCERWQQSFENFLADMGEPAQGMSLDRIDNNGPYSPENCQWATRLEQQNNRRATHMLTYNDRTQSLSDWITELHLNRPLVLYRLRYGWPIHEAFTIPPGLSLIQGRALGRTTKVCSACNKEKPLNHFYAHHARCKRCFMQGKQSPPQPKRITNLEIAERDNWTCHICHGTVTRKDWSLDHIIPFTKGGKRVRENLLLAHKLCNQRRSNKPLERAS